MYLTISKWINILSILLALFAMGELIFTATILFLVSMIICKTGGYMTSILGLIASLVCLPTAFKVKSLFSGYGIRIRHLDMQSYHRLMLYISLGAQTFCVLMCCVTLAQTNSLQGNFASAVTRYLQRYSDKYFVDLVQTLFHCCGVFSYQDWANTNWISMDKQELFCQEKRVANVTMKTCPIADEKKVRLLFSVPYSCCKMESTRPCRNFDLKCSGTDTINTVGCLTDLTNFMLAILCSEIVICVLIIVLIVALLKFLNMEESELCCNEYEDFVNEPDDNDSDESKWEKFTNSADLCKLRSFEHNPHLAIQGKVTRCDKSNTAELIPTCQEQILLNDAKVEIVSTEEINDVQDETYELISCSKEYLVSRDDSYCSCSSSDELEINNETFKLVPINNVRTVKKKPNVDTVLMALTRKRVRFK